MATEDWTDAGQLIRELLAQGSESRVDYKSPRLAPSSRPAWANLAKHVIGLSNRKDGGYMLIGVEDGTFKAHGLSDDQVATWDAARVNAALAGYAAPRPVVQVICGSLEDGTVLLALRVAEFEEQPLVCTKSIRDDQGSPVLRQGALYIRTEDTETREVSTEAEMRELLSRAYVKRAERLLHDIKALIDALAGSRSPGYAWPG